MIKMPAKIKDKFQKTKQKEKLNECEGALIKMGYLRKKATNKPNKPKQKKPKKKKVNKKIEDDSEEDEDEATEIA